MSSLTAALYSIQFMLTCAVFDGSSHRYRGTDKSFVDIDLTENTWYYYSAYAYSKMHGWSMVNTDACDAVQVGVAKQNLNRGSWAQSNTGRQLTYGLPVEYGNGDVNTGPSGTDWTKSKFGWRPGGSHVWVLVDLGKMHKLSRFVTHQRSFHFQYSKMRIYTSNDLKSWSGAGTWDMAHGSHLNGGNSRQERRFASSTARYVRISYWTAPGQYVR